jgi:hypothetical protein
MLGAALLLSTSCQRIEEPVPRLTQDQWRRVSENILQEAPGVQHPIDAVFGDRFRLIGWDMEPGQVGAGGEFTMTFYWECLQATTQRWHIFVHLDSSLRQNLDHEAVMSSYPTVYWQPGDIIRDTVRGTLNERTQEGAVQVLIGFFAGDERMAVTRAGEGELQEDGRLRIGSFQAASEPYEIRRWTGRFQLDGRLDEGAWRNAQQTEPWGDANTGDAQTPATWAKVLWDEEFLYVGMHADDPDIWSTLTERDGELWNEEVLELYIDAQRTGRDYLEFQVNPLGTVFDARFPRHTNRDWPSAAHFDLEGLELAVHVDGTVNERADTDRSWTVEMRIPHASLPGMPRVPPETGDRIRMNFYRYERSGEDNRTLYYAWNPVVSGSFHQPDRFGEAVFSGPSRRAPRRRPAAGETTEGEGSGAVPSAPGPRPRVLTPPVEGSGGAPVPR